MIYLILYLNLIIYNKFYIDLKNNFKNNLNQIIYIIYVIIIIKLYLNNKK